MPRIRALALISPLLLLACGEGPVAVQATTPDGRSAPRAPAEDPPPAEPPVAPPEEEDPPQAPPEETPLEIVLLPTTYRDLTIDESTVFPIALASRFDHLDLDAGDTPWIHFRTSEGASAEYRYLVNGSVRRDFQAPFPVAIGVWGVPIAYQSLGLALAEAPGALHTIEIRAMRGGRSTVRRLDFTLDVESPPVRLENCRLAETLDAFSLDDLTLHQMFDGQPVPVVTADLRYPIEPVEGGLSPTALPIIVGNVDVELRVVALGMDKFSAWAPVDHPITGLADAPDCPYDVPGGIAALFDGGVNEVTRVADGATTCDLSGPYPDYVLANSVLDEVFAGARGRVAAARSGDLALSLQAEAVAPEIRIGGATFGWSTDPDLEPPFFPGGGRERYYVPPSLGLHFTGADRFIESTGAPLQDLWFETRVFIQGFEIEVSPISIEASHPDLPQLRIDVERDASCATPLVFSIAATP